MNIERISVLSLCGTLREQALNSFLRRPSIRDFDSRSADMFRLDGKTNPIARHGLNRLHPFGPLLRAAAAAKRPANFVRLTPYGDLLVLLATAAPESITHVYSLIMTSVPRIATQAHLSTVPGKEKRLENEALE